MIRPEDINPKPVEYLLTHGSDNPNVQIFLDWYVRPLQMQKRGKMVEIIDPGIRLENLPYRLIGLTPPDDLPQVADPTLYLNHLFYQVMKTGSGDLPIPHEVVYGFSNCGVKSFFQAFRYSFRKDVLLSSVVQYPAHLVIERRDGSLHWSRRAESGTEQLFHFLFFLRATMAHLAIEPIGKKTTLTGTDIAQWLIQLPKRAAYVRSGEEMGVIYTNDVPPSVDTATFRERMAFIQSQTRQKYCKAETEAENQSEAQKETKPESKPKKSRFEDIE